MDFLKDNLFYAVMIGAVIAVSVPSYVLGAKRREAVRLAMNQAETKIRQLGTRVNKLEKVGDETLERAGEFKKAWNLEKERVLARLLEADRHLDHDFLVPVDAKTGLPPPEDYKQAYYKAYGSLAGRIQKAGLKSTKKSPLPERENWKTRRPTEFEMRVTQKKYWILKALVDILTDPECGVVSVQQVVLDHVPNAQNVYNRPDGAGRFWRYPVRIEMIIDFQRFPVFMEKFISREDIFFDPPGFWKMVRAFDETKPVYVPQVSVSFYVDVWDYISTKFEKGNREMFRRRAQRENKGGGR